MTPGGSRTDQCNPSRAKPIEVRPANHDGPGGGTGRDGQRLDYRNGSLQFQFALIH
jgi:hypothetical protein